MLKKFNIIFLLISFVNLNCLSYFKKDVVVSSKELSRTPLDSIISYEVTEEAQDKGIVYKIIEVKTDYAKFQIERNIKIEKSITENGMYNFGNPDFPNSKTRDNYWGSWLGSILLFGLGLLFTPIVLFDWITLPFRTIDGSKVDIIEQEKKVGEVKYQSANNNLVLYLKNAKKEIYKVKVDKGKAFIPYNLFDIIELGNNSSTKTYEVEVIDQTKNVSIYSNYIESNSLNNEEFYKLYNAAIERKEQKDYNRCINKFPISNLQSARTFISNGLYLKKDEYLAEILLRKVCKKYLGTDAESKCIIDFNECIERVRKVDNKNLKYEEE